MTITDKTTGIQRRAMYDQRLDGGFPLINQSGVQLARLDPDDRYNACWDGILTRDGRVLCPAATEITVGDYVSLLEYHFESNRFTRLFYGGNVFGLSDRTIRPSKLHFSMNELPDGRIIATTHTTDRAPGHPSWLYEAFYDSPWEGYSGSNVVVFDPATNTVENWGQPVPRETIYGAKYNPADNCLYMIGFARGHLYRMDLDERIAHDLGKVSEHKTFGLHVGPDECIYGAARSGRMFRCRPGEQEVEFLDARLVGTPQHGYTGLQSSSISSAVNLPDRQSFLIATFLGGDHLYRFDTEDATLVDLGSLRSEERYWEQKTSIQTAYSLVLDSNGVLWYALTCYPTRSEEGNGDFAFRPGPSLMRWDLSKPRPENLGMIGVPERSLASVTALLLDEKTQRLYAVDSNHGTDGFAVVAIDLEQWRPHMHERGPLCHDGYLVPDTPRYVEQRQRSVQMHKCMEENSPFLDAEWHKVVPLWELVPPRESGVLQIEWRAGAFDVVTGADKPKWYFRVRVDGAVIAQERTANLLHEPLVPLTPKQPPVVNGRTLRSAVTASVPWCDGKVLFGTADGAVGIESEQGTYALGSVCVSGPVRCLATDPAHTAVWGVAGDRDDIGVLFRYDGREGLRHLGKLRHDAPSGTIGSSNRLSAVAVDDCATVVAVGSDDQLGVIHLIPC